MATKSKIVIGGILSLNRVEEFCTCIQLSEASLRFGGPFFKPKTEDDLIYGRKIICNASYLCLYTDDAIWPGFPLIETFLLKMNIGFTILTRVNSEYNILCEYRPEIDFYYSSRTDSVFDPLIREKNLRVIAAYLEKARKLKRRKDVYIDAALTVLHEELKPPHIPLPDFEIMRLRQPNDE